MYNPANRNTVYTSFYTTASIALRMVRCGMVGVRRRCCSAARSRHVMLGRQRLRRNGKGTVMVHDASWCTGMQLSAAARDSTNTRCSRSNTVARRCVTRARRSPVTPTRRPGSTGAPVNWPGPLLSIRTAGPPTWPPAATPVVFARVSGCGSLHACIGEGARACRLARCILAQLNPHPSGLRALTALPCVCEDERPPPVPAASPPPLLLGRCSAQMLALPWHGSRTVAMLRTGST